MGDRLKDRVAVVTGAAQGNGRAFSEAFAEEGAHVLVVDIQREVAERTAQEIGRGAIALAADVSLAADAVRIIEDSVSFFGRVDVFVNSAGVIGRFDFLDISEAEWDRVMNVNLKGTFLCGQAAARQMATQGSGSIINIASDEAAYVTGITLFVDGGWLTVWLGGMGTGQKHLLGNQLPLALFARRSTLIEVKAELVGNVWKIIAKPGDAVIEDQPLLIIE